MAPDNAQVEFHDIPCPCESGNAYPVCCQPFLRGQKDPPTAEALMRSRYTAYVRDDQDYLSRTWDTDAQGAADENVSGNLVEWRGLEILRTEAGTAIDKVGIVEFVARFSIDGKQGQLHEISRFARDQGRWVYVDGAPAGGSPVRSRKVGRNSPCPCGSGKKYKRCCGA